jgi:peptidoglycan/LPS O-acetylase OafA/YrhL
MGRVAVPIIDILTAQLTDLFRIGLIIALIFTARRNAAATGWWLPLGLGVIFVAVMIPATLQSQSTEPFWRLAMVGVVANLVILAVALGGLTAFKRFRG